MKDIKKLQKFADNDSPKACYELGMEYYFGNYIKKDLDKAFDLLYKAYKLGYMCFFSLQMIYDEINSQKLL